MDMAEKQGRQGHNEVGWRRPLVNLSSSLRSWARSLVDWRPSCSQVRRRFGAIDGTHVRVGTAATTITKTAQLLFEFSCKYGIGTRSGDFFLRSLGFDHTKLLLEQLPVAGGESWLSSASILAAQPKSLAPLAGWMLTVASSFPLLAAFAPML